MVFLKSRPCTCCTWMWLWYRSICQIGFPACRRISDFTTWVCQLNQNDGQLCPFKWRGMYGKWSFILPLGTSRCIHTTCTYTRIISRSYSTLINTSYLCIRTMVSHFPSLLGERISGHIGLTTLCYGVYNLYCLLHGAVEWVLFDIISYLLSGSLLNYVHSDSIWIQYLVWLSVPTLSEEQSFHYKAHRIRWACWACAVPVNGMLIQCMRFHVTILKR